MVNWVFWVSVLLMLIGVLGTILPLLPGLILIFVTALGYGIYDHFQHISPVMLVVLAVLTGLGLSVDYFAGVIGAKSSGASRYGIWGALLGGILGILFLPWGVLLFPPAGAIIGELIAGKNWSEAVASAWGTCLGMMGGAIAKVLLALLMTGLFIWEVLT